MIFMTIYDGLKHTYHGYAREELKFYSAGGIMGLRQVRDLPI